VRWRWWWSTRWRRGVCAGDAHDFRVMCTLFGDQSAFTSETPSLPEQSRRSSKIVDLIYSYIQDTEPRRLACSRNVELYLSEHVS